MTVVATELAPFPNRVLNCLKSPGHGDETGIAFDGDALCCPQTGERWSLVEGVPTLFQSPANNDRPVTEKVKLGTITSPCNSEHFSASSNPELQLETATASATPKYWAMRRSYSLTYLKLVIIPLSNMSLYLSSTAA